MKHATPLSLSQIERLRAEVLSRVQRRYRTLTERLTLAGPDGPVAVDFTRVEDPNRVLDQVAAEEDRRERVSGSRKPGDQLHLPYWAELWDSALGMGQLLLKRFRVADGRTAELADAAAAVVADSRPPGAADTSPPPVASLTARSGSLSRLNVLDLGCGMGFTGMIAASLGHSVLFADLEPPALLFARLNSIRWADRIRTRQLNWQTARLGERFDLIIGADILYERNQWEFLEPFWRIHLADGGSVLLGEPGRQTGDDFPAWVRPRGWNVTHHQEPVPTRSRPIRLFELQCIQ